MAEQTIDDIFENCHLIIEQRGQVEPVNLLRYSVIFKDKKMMIEGLLDSSHTKFERMMILINLPPRYRYQPSAIQQERAVFGLPEKNLDPEDKWTMVYLWKERKVFHRPGAWQDYLERLGREIRNDLVKIRGFNGTRIDDTELFEY